MSFTVTSHSIIRFESSAKQEDEAGWKRTLMFFNVDISGEVRCDHRNEITASRTQDRNGKQRNPGGGLSNPIREGAMSFKVPNKFYSSVIPGGQRNNREDFRSHTHFHYRSPKPRQNLADIASSSPDSDDYNHHFADKSDQIEEYKSYSEEADYSGDRYKRGPISERPHDYNTKERSRRSEEPYVPAPYRTFRPRYQEEQPYSNSIIISRESPRSPTEYASNYDNNYSNVYKDHNKAGGYERRFEPKDYDFEERFRDLPERDNQIRYSLANDSDYENEEKRPRPSLTPSPKSEAKSRRHYGKKTKPYKAYKEKVYSMSPSRNHRTETDTYFEPVSSHSLYTMPYKAHKEKDYSMSPSRNRRTETDTYYEPVSSHSPYTMPYKAYKEKDYHTEKVSSRKHSDHFKRIQDTSGQDDRISRHILGTASPKWYKDNFKTKEKMPQRSSEKTQFKYYAEPEILQPYRKYRVEVPRSKYKNRIHDEIPRRQWSSGSSGSSEGSTYSSETVLPTKYYYHEPRSSRKSSPRKEKQVVYNSEIPYRTRIRSTPAVSLVFDIPYKKKKRKKSFALAGQHVQRRPDSGCDTGTQHSNRNCKVSREPSLEVGGIQPSFDFNSNKPSQRLLNRPFMDYKDISETHTAVAPKPSNHCLLETNETIPTSGQNSTQPNPSLASASPSCPCRKGQGSHYPTVYRGKCKEIPQYSMYNFQNSKCDPCDRDLPNSRRVKSSCKLCKQIFSRNHSLNSNNKNDEPIKQSKINACLNIPGTDVSLTSSPRIVSSKVISSLVQGGSKSFSPSASTQLSGGSLKENLFKSVRFSPAPSICSSSKSINSGPQRTQSPRTTRINRKSIKTYLKPASCYSCSLRRIGTKYGFTRESCFRLANQKAHHTWSPDKEDSNCSRRPRPGLDLPNIIEMCSRPPTRIQCDLNKISSMKEVNNNLGRTSNNRVTLNTNSSSSFSSNIRCGNDSKGSDKSRCYKEIRDIDIMEKPKYHNRRIDLGPRITYSWPIQNLRSYPPRRTSSGSTMSKFSGTSSQSSENMQLVCLQDPTYRTCSTGPQTKFTRSCTALPCRCSPGSKARRHLCRPKLILDWEESSCRRSIVEQLKRELLQTLRTEQQIESHSYGPRATPHIMLVPYVPEQVRPPSICSNPFCRPEPVVCWAACSKPPSF